MEIKNPTRVPDSLDIKLECAARHEAGHMAIAAVNGVKLRSEGIVLDSDGEGLACYCKEPEGSDLSREQVILAMLAGFAAENRFRKQCSYSALDPLGITLSPDRIEARTVELTLSNEYFLNETLLTILAKLERRSERLVEQYWPVIDAVAAALLAKDWEPLKTLKSGTPWSKATTAKCLAGEEVVRILERCGIVSCVLEN